MPQTEVLIYQEDEGEAPLITWLDDIPKKAQDKCLVRIERLEEMGHELRRPEADFLRDGIYELRTKHQKVNYRILYFFSNKAAVLSHGLTKEKEVPPEEIDQALVNKAKFEKKPDQHTYKDKEE